MKINSRESKKGFDFNYEEAGSFYQELKTTNDDSPEDILIKEAEQDKIGAAYGALIKKDPSQAGAILLDFAKQKYGLDDQGKVMKEVGKVILNKKIDWAVTKAFPKKESVIEVINNIDTAGNNKED